MLIAIDTQRMAEILASYVKASRECEADGDEDNAKLWQDKFDRSTDFLEKLGIVAYLDEHYDYQKVMVYTKDMHFLR